MQIEYKNICAVDGGSACGNSRRWSGAAHFARSVGAATRTEAGDLRSEAFSETRRTAAEGATGAEKI